MVTRSDSTLTSSAIASDLPSHPVLGDLAAILSACFYAIYVILLKKQVGDEDRADMQLMLGYV
jgi:solute carrier family 35 protein F5